MGAAASVAQARGGEPPGAAAYTVTSGCPDRAQWLAGLRARLPPLLRTHPAIDGLAVHVAREAQPASSLELYRGELSSSVDLAPGVSRQVHGARCEDVLEALAFMAALSLERLSAREQADAPALASTAPDGAAQPGSAALGADASPRAAESSAGTGSVRLGALAFASIQGAIAPKPQLDAGAGVSASWQMEHFQPWVLLGLYWGSSEQERFAGTPAQVRYRHWVAHLVGCPWRFPSATSMALRPCIDVDLGRLEADGTGVTGATEHAAPWLSAGAELRFEVSLWDRVQLGASAGLVAPFWRSRFYFLPQVTAFQVPALGFRADSAISVLF